MENELIRYIVFIYKKGDVNFYINREHYLSRTNDCKTIRDIDLEECSTFPQPFSFLEGRILYFDNTKKEWCIWLNDMDIKFTFKEFIYKKVMNKFDNIIAMCKDNKEEYEKAIEYCSKLMDCCESLPLSERMKDIVDMMKEND